MPVCVRGETIIMGVTMLYCILCLTQCIAIYDWILEKGSVYGILVVKDTGI